jgi:hypothetical protein
VYLWFLETRFFHFLALEKVFLLEVDSVVVLAQALLAHTPTHSSPPQPPSPAEQ